LEVSLSSSQRDLHLNHSHLEVQCLLLGRGFSSKYGARNLRREIQSSLEKPISELLLENVFVSGNKVKVDTSDGQFTFNSVRKKRMSSNS